jgi:hypothetical protein
MSSDTSVPRHTPKRPEAQNSQDAQHRPALPPPRPASTRRAASTPRAVTAPKAHASKSTPKENSGLISTNQSRLKISLWFATNRNSHSGYTNTSVSWLTCQLPLVYGSWSCKSCTCCSLRDVTNKQSEFSTITEGISFDRSLVIFVFTSSF